MFTEAEFKAGQHVHFTAGKSLTTLEYTPETGKFDVTTDNGNDYKNEAVTDYNEAVKLFKEFAGLN